MGSGRGHAAAGSLPPLLCPVLNQPGRGQVVWACCRNSTPWCSNALTLCKQHHAGALSRSLNSPPGRPGSLLKFHVIVCVVASAGLVQPAHACLCISRDRTSCSAAPFLPLSFPQPLSSRVVRVQCLWRSGRRRGPRGTPLPPHGPPPQRNGRPSRHPARGQGRGRGTGDAVSTRHAHHSTGEHVKE